MKKIITYFFALTVLLFSLNLFGADKASASSPYSDLPSTHKNYAEIMEMYNKGYLKGVYKDGKFNPEKNVTRESVAKILQNINYKPSVLGRLSNTTYLDVKVGDENFELVSFVYNYGYMKGNLNFYLTRPMTMKDYSKAMVRLSNGKLKDYGTYHLTDVKDQNVLLIHANNITDDWFRTFGSEIEYPTNAEAVAGINRILKIKNEGIYPKREPFKVIYNNVAETFKSEYGFDWVLKNNAKGYVNPEKIELYGMDKNGYQVGSYTTYKNLAQFGIRIGEDTAKTVKAKLGTPLEHIKRKDGLYKINNVYNGKAMYHTYYINSKYVTFFYDNHKGDVVRSIMWINEEVEMAKGGFYGTPSAELQESFERLMIRLLNQSRASEGLDVLTAEQQYREIARKHSQEMADYNYFSHTNRKGYKADRRMLDGGMRNLYFWGENLSYGQFSSIYAHEALMNSKGHRDNILRKEFKNLYTGVAFNKSGVPFYTMNFYSYKK